MSQIDLSRPTLRRIAPTLDTVRRPATLHEDEIFAVRRPNVSIPAGCVGKAVGVPHCLQTDAGSPLLLQ
jgi:hypothetical protein